MNELYNKSPLNYTGGKYKLLKQIIPLFPKEIVNCYDIFCGGANVAVNMKAQKIVANDINEHLIDLFSFLKGKSADEAVKLVKEVVSYYNLTDTQVNGYEYYACNSSEGLANKNREAFEKMKADYNDPSFQHFHRSLMFYVVVVFAFNNQIRFNKKGQYNISVGKRDFNAQIEKNFREFVSRLESLDIVFQCGSYKDVMIEDKKSAFVYADPPYLISTATYNESGGWTKDKERELLDYLVQLDKEGVKFALSNVIEHRGQKNEILESWIKENNFIMHNLNFSYNNSSYQAKDKAAVTVEVLVTNYESE